MFVKALATKALFFFYFGRPLFPYLSQSSPLLVKTICHTLYYIPQVFSECRRADRGCVLFIRDIVLVWNTLSTLLRQLCRARAAGENTLLLATSDVHHDLLPPEVGIVDRLSTLMLWNKVVFNVTKC